MMIKHRNAQRPPYFWTKPVILRWLSTKALRSTSKPFLRQVWHLADERSVVTSAAHDAKDWRQDPRIQSCPSPPVPRSHPLYIRILQMNRIHLWGYEFYWGISEPSSFRILFGAMNPIKNEHESIISCRTPVWLKTAFAVLVQEGGGIGARLVRGKRKIGARVGLGREKIGAGVGSCRSMDPVGISSGSRRDPVGHQFLHFWAPLLASRDPVGIQSGSSRAPMSGGSQMHKKHSIFAVFLRVFGWFGCFPTGPNVVQKNSKIGAPTGQKRVPKKC